MKPALSMKEHINLKEKKLTKWKMKILIFNVRPEFGWRKKKANKMYFS